MTNIASIILPVFLVIGFGYVARWRGYFTDAAVDGLMKFAQGFAIPCLLFNAIATLDLADVFDLGVLVSFYTGALAGFAVGTFGARLIFGRSWEDAVAIGFCGLFSNSLLLGLPITERAYGTQSLTANFAIIAIHAPLCYAIGITTMELIRARGAPLAHLPQKVLRAMFRNAIIIGISLGFVVNLSGVPVPAVLSDALALMIRAALPAALFGLGGVLYRYRPEGDLRTILFIVSVSLVLHPTVAWGMAWLMGVDRDGVRSIVLTAAMAPGVNAYLFADMYGNARRVAASSVLVGTALTIVTASIWIVLLP